MIVKNIHNSQSDIPENFRQYAFGQDDSGKLPLTNDKKYVVASVKTVKGQEFYLILADDGELKGSPWWYPSNLFAVLDDTEPEDWTEDNSNAEYRIKGFKEIVDDPDGAFYGRLEDGDAEAVKVFLQHYEAYARSSNLWYADGKSA
jgi:hypothetical protein